MLKGSTKLNFPEKKARKAFPDRLGSLVAGFDDKREEQLGGFDSAFESGEELETFGPNDGFGSGRETQNDGVEGFDDETVNGVSGFQVRMKPERESAASVSVLEAIAADEKRSDLEYEVRFCCLS